MSPIYFDSGSQPYGFHNDGPTPKSGLVKSCTPEHVALTKDMFAAVPLECSISRALTKDLDHDFFKNGTKVKKDRPFPKECSDLGLNDFVSYPGRFFINISSHIQWYLDRGVDVTAVILMRDNTISRISKTKIICRNDTVAKQQNEHANDFTREAIRNFFHTGRVILVSFEGLVSLKEEYLFSIYKQLNIESDYIPSFIDANLKYIRKDDKKKGK